MNRGEWFSQARFGMFIHWGLYSLPGGIWHGKSMEYIGEWLQSHFRIPCAEYEKLAAEFNPIEFDADAWVRTAAEAGMRYLVFSAKHHDGFAMYHSKVDRFNIVDATPFGRDPLAEIAAACRRYGLKLGVYYSQDLDWHHPDGGDPGPKAPQNVGMSWGNDWDFPNHGAKKFQRYFDGKVIPQLTELLTGYGEISVVWFDCPLTISKDNSLRLIELIRKHHPECLVNTRIGHGLGDYGSFGDNQLPSAKADGLWETPGTLNHTWGFKWNDHHWKSSAEVIKLLVTLAEKNTNYLLNIGPRPDGAFPQESIEILRKTGDWLNRYGKTIYGCHGTPFPAIFEWGHVTVNYGHGHTRINLFINPGQSHIRIHGLNDDILRCYDPVAPEHKIRYTQNPAEKSLDIYLNPADESAVFQVVILELACTGEPSIDRQLTSRNGVLRLPAAAGDLCHGSLETEDTGLRNMGAAGERLTAASHSHLDHVGNLVEWHNPSDRIQWHAFFPDPGPYRFEVVTVSRVHGAPWATGQQIELCLSEGGHDTVLQATLQGAPAASEANRCYTQVVAEAGTLPMHTPGRKEISLRMLNYPNPEALKMAFAELRIYRHPETQ